MASVTLAIAAVLSLLAFVLSPMNALIVFIAARIWYPPYLTVPMGTIDFSVSRIVTIALFANILLRTRLVSKFRLITLDKVVLVYFAAQIIAGFMTTPISQLIENRAGAFLDLAMPYFAVRLIVINKKRYITLLKVFVTMAVVLASVGVYQCIGGYNPYTILRRYHAWTSFHNILPKQRLGLYRASVCFSVHIMYGLFFAITGPICAGLYYHIKGNRQLYVIAMCMFFVGLFTSLSSGPALAALLAIGFIGLYNYRQHWKKVALLAMLLCLGVEILSNRHFYDVLGGFTLNPETAYYRSRLITVALFEGGMKNHWLAGYGFVDPGWCFMIDGREETDIVNHYLYVLCRFGIIGLIPFIAILVQAFKRLKLAFAVTRTHEDRWLVWCLLGTMYGIACSLVTVALFGQTSTIFYIILAMCGVMPTIINKSNYQLMMRQEEYDLTSQSMEYQSA